jgi:dephospho-CoA kinase
MDPLPSTMSLLHRYGVALTGSIGTGKSTVADIFAELGAHIIDADKLAREVVEPSSPGLTKIKETFGDHFIRKDGTLDRKKLGEVVFQDPFQKKQLENILHPLIRSRALEEFQNRPKDKLFIYVVPLLFESGSKPEFIKNIVTVTAPQHTAIERIMTRDGCTRRLAEKKWLSQLSQETKVLLSDHVIENSGNLEDLRMKIVSVYKSLLADNS